MRKPNEKKTHAKISLALYKKICLKKIIIIKMQNKKKDLIIAINLK
jgi:hypothetical protein